MFSTSRFIIASATLISVAACTDRAPVEPGRMQGGSVGEQALVAIVPPPDPTQFTSITAGYEHVCARQQGGDVYCWGANDNMQVGTGTSDASCHTGCVFAPTFVIKGTQVSAGGHRTCALVTAPRPAGATNAECWGGGHSGLPIWVFGSSDFRSIAAGPEINCGPTSAGLQCLTLGQVAFVKWGGSFYGQTALGTDFGCAIETGGGSFLDCWGMNTSGQTGVDPSQFPSPQTLIRTPLGSAVTHVATGNNYSCVDQSAGTVNCFGANDVGQLGAGIVSAIPGWTYQPQTVFTLSCSLFSGCRGVPASLHAVTAGVRHACALDPNGAAYCWGENNLGELGNGTRTNSAYAVAVAGSHTFRSIAAGYQQTCAVGTDNVIYCWGDGYNGELGTGIPSDASLVPKPTAPLRRSVPTT